MAYVKIYNKNKRPLGVVNIDEQVEKSDKERLVTLYSDNLIPCGVANVNDILSQEEDTHDYSKDYLTFTALEDGTFQFSQNALQYSVDGGETWETLTADTATPTITAGSKILWKQTGLTPSSFYGIGGFSSTCKFNVSGNAMSLLYGDNFVEQQTLPNYSFLDLFRQCSVVLAKDLVLPATTLANNCYNSMFNNCTSLTTAPKLPATTLAEHCYDNMFYSCTSLTSAPELPATTLAQSCYQGMFNNCTSLTSAPELPATTLAQYCYYNMFYGCTSLTSAPELSATTLEAYCYGSMFYGCASLNYIKCLATNISATNCTASWVQNVSASGTFVKDASMSSWNTGNSGIPSGWTVVDAS